MFEGIYGHQRIKDNLTHLVVTSEFPPAFLFTGISGIGKYSLAREFAKAMNCTDRDPHMRPCKSCKNCTSFEHASAPDFIELLSTGDAESVTRYFKLFNPDKSSRSKKKSTNSIKIAQVREVIEQVNIAKVIGKFKVVLIKDAKDVTTEASNILLKTLE